MNTNICGITLTWLFLRQSHRQRWAVFTVTNSPYQEWSEEISLTTHSQCLDIHPNSFEIFLRYCVRWIQLQCDLKFLECFIQFPQLCEGDSIIQMRARKVRANADYFGKLRLRFLNFSFTCQFASQ